MKSSRLLALLLLLTAMCTVLSPRTAKAEISFSYFYDALDPYGDWIEVDGYGYCWRPDDVDEDWAPYTDGYWAYTDAGWTWVSYEDWGGIAYHYGRWIKLEDEGWCWVPDYQWGPAWVSWRNNEESIGWAPLPPEARFQRETGFSVWVDDTYDIGPSHYNFCHVRDFGAPVIRSVIYPRSRNVTIIEHTINITNITFNHVNKIVFCGGPTYVYINEHSHHRVPTLKIVQNNTINVFVNNGANVTLLAKKTNRAANPLPRAVQRGNALEVFAPTIQAPINPRELKPTRLKTTAANQAVNKGWNGIKDPASRDQLKQKLHNQNNGQTPNTTPAKPVQVADLKVVPEKADFNAPPTLPRMNPKDGNASRPGQRPDKNENVAVRPATPPTASTEPGDKNGKNDRKGKPGAGDVDPKDKRATANPATPAGVGTAGENRQHPDNTKAERPLKNPTANPFNQAKDPDSKNANTNPPGEPRTPAVLPRKPKDTQPTATAAAEAAAREERAREALARRLEQNAELRKNNPPKNQPPANDPISRAEQPKAPDSNLRPSDPRSKVSAHEDRQNTTPSTQDRSRAEQQQAAEARAEQQQRAQDAQRESQAGEKADRANQARQQQAAEARAEQQQRAQDAQRENQAREKADRANQARQQQAAEARAEQQQRAQDAQRENQAREKADRANQARQQQAAEARAEQQQRAQDAQRESQSREKADRANQARQQQAAEARAQQQAAERAASGKSKKDAEESEEKKKHGR